MVVPDTEYLYMYVHYISHLRCAVDCGPKMLPDGVPPNKLPPVFVDVAPNRPVEAELCG